MSPHIIEGEYVLIDTLVYRWKSPTRGDIIAFRHERSAPSIYLKRVVGVPGDRIEIRSGVVYVNGAQLDERYVQFRDTRSAAPAVVPAGSYYVLGDNRANSDDSRTWGFVPAGDVVGRARFGVWPPDRFGTL